MIDLTVNTRGVELTDWLEQHLQNKIGRMDRYLPVLAEGQVELAKEAVKDASRRYVAQVTLRGGRTVIRAEERGNDIAAAIDAVEHVLYRQIVRLKGKRFARARAAMVQVGGEPPPLPEEVMAELEEEEALPIVRVKRFTLQPMDEEEAIEQMELLGHDFFVFYNANVGRVNVVYRRKDGNYGLLDPEVA